MSDALLKLSLEHRNIAGVLALMEEQLRRLERGRPVDRALLLLGLDYLAGFPDQCHHPKENLIFKKLRERHPERAQGLGDLLWHHDDLEQSTARLAGLVRQGWTQKSLLESRLRNFVADYRGHMVAEEMEFFPAAATLSEQDLAEIDFDLLDRPDPLVSPDEERRFERLRAEIQRLANEQLEREEPDLPAHVDDFNRAVEAEGLRLVGREGGWALEHGRETVLELPPCSAQRAAWCAHSFLVGRAAGLERRAAGLERRSAGTPR